MKTTISSSLLLSILLAWLLSFQVAQAQPSGATVVSNGEIEQLEPELATNSYSLAEHLKPGGSQNWLDFRPGTVLQPQQLFRQFAADFGLGSEDEMKAVKTTTDQVGNSHYRFQQYHSGHKVVGAEFIVHVNSAGETYSANGKLARNMQQNQQQLTSEAVALATAKSSLPGAVFVPPHWHPTPDEPQFPQQNLLQTGELVWMFPEGGSPQVTADLKLVWVFELYEQTGTQNRTVYVDAASGQILRWTKISMGCDYATGNTTWNGNQVAYTNEFGTTSHYLDYDCASYGGGGIRTLNQNGDGTSITDYFDADNSWTSFNDQAGYTTHWSAREVNRYFHLELGRDNYDDAGGDLTLYTNCSFINSTGDTYYTNAFYSGGGVCRFGSGTAAYDPTRHYNTLDIVGHEITHGIVDETADLIYADESGALNESFADIFGQTVEMWSEGTAPDWLLAEDLPGNPIRSLIDPNFRNDPDTYQGSFWYSGSADNGGVHTNSGVQNYWFYLLSEGAVDVNDNGVPFEVNGIGWEDAAAIAYGNLSNYLISSSDYTDAREGAIRASNDLFGTCSNQTLQTAQAWRAVGVGPELSNWDADAICGFDYSPFLIDYVVSGIESLTAGGGGCSVTVSPSFADLSVVFRAGEQVRLLPGFRTNPSANFYTLLDPCASTAYRHAPAEVEDAEAAFARDPSKEKLVEELSLIAAQPNPFVDRTTLSIAGLDGLQNAAQVNELQVRELQVFDQTGKQIRTITVESSEALVVDLSDEPAGVYLCRLTVDGVTLATEKLIKVN